MAKKETLKDATFDVIMTQVVFVKEGVKQFRILTKMKKVTMMVFL